MPYFNKAERIKYPKLPDRGKREIISIAIRMYIFIIIFPLVLFFLTNSASFANETPEIFVQMGHTMDVNAVIFSSNGEYFASGSADHTIKLWEISTGKEVRTFMGHSGSVISIVFSPDGEYLASGSADNTIKLWEISTGKEVRTFVGHSSSVTSVAFSPNGKYILSACRFDHKIKLWDVSTGKDIRFFKHIGVNTVVFSPNGKHAISGGYQTIKIWDIITGSEILTINNHLDTVKSIDVSHDGKYIISGDNGNAIKLWQISTGKEIKSLNGHTKTVNSVTFSPDDKYLLSVSDDNTIKLWEVSKNKELQSFDGYSASDKSVSFSPDGQFIIHMGFYNNPIKLREVLSGNEIRAFQGYANPVYSAVVSANGKHFISGHMDSIIRFWDISEGKKVRSLAGPKFGVQSLTLSPDEKYILAGNWLDSTKMFELAKSSETRIFPHGPGVSAIAVSPDSKNVLFGSDDLTIKLWDILTGKEIKTFYGHKRGISSVAYSPDGKHALSGSKDSTIKLWDILRGKETKNFIGHTDYVTSVRFSPDGKYILSGGLGVDFDNALKLWDVATGKEIRSFQDNSAILSAVFNPEGTQAISGSSNGIIKLWEVQTGKEIRTFKGHEGSVHSVAFMPDAVHALSAGNDGTIRIWNISTQKEVAKFIGFSDDEWIVITPEGYYNASENGDKHLNVRINNKVYSIDHYLEAFYRPDLVKLALAGGSLKQYRNIANVKKPPKISIVNTANTVTNNEVAVTVRLVEDEGGTGDVRLYLNSSVVVLDTRKKLKTPKSDNKNVYYKYTLKLSNGLNIIKAIAFNNDNSMQSPEAIHEITAKFKSVSKPSLNALIIGINEFKNPNLKLNYPIADAILFADVLKKAASGLFENVNIKKLVTIEETTNENIIKELKKYQDLNPDDLFVFYIASHGTVDDGEYFLITSNVGSTSTVKLKTDALSQSTLKELIANIPATKKLMLIDTCNAGALGDAIQAALLTRGMSEDAAIKILSRAVGSTILSASTSVQDAVEGYNGHGLFTFVVTEGFKGKADKNKTGFIKTIDLADYVDTEVPVLAEKIFRRAQYPTISISGQAFPIGKVIPEL